MATLVANATKATATEAKVSRSFGRWRAADGTLKKGNIAKDAALAGGVGLLGWSLFDDKAGDKIGGAFGNIGNTFGSMFGGLFGGLTQGVFSGFMGPLTCGVCCSSCISSIIVLVILMMK